MVLKEYWKEINHGRYKQNDMNSSGDNSQSYPNEEEKIEESNNVIYDNADEEETIPDDVMPIEDIYKQNIGALSSLSNVKEDANIRFNERKLSFAKHSSALRITIVAFISIMLFYYRVDINNLIIPTISNYLNNEEFILNFIFTVICFITRNLHIITFLYFTRILPIIFDLLIFF